MDAIYTFELHGRRREDGSVFITSPDLPLFSCVGKDEPEARHIALTVLQEYLRENVPDFVNLKVAKRIGERFGIHSNDDGMPPVHVMAMVRGKSSDATGSEGSC